MAKISVATENSKVERGLQHIEQILRDENLAIDCSSDRICEYNPNFNYENYWNELLENQKYFIKCRVVVKCIDVTLKKNIICN